MLKSVVKDPGVIKNAGKGYGRTQAPRVKFAASAGASTGSAEVLQGDASPLARSDAEEMSPLATPTGVGVPGTPDEVAAQPDPSSALVAVPAEGASEQPLVAMATDGQEPISPRKRISPGILSELSFMLFFRFRI